MGLQNVEMPLEYPDSVLAGRVAVVAPDVGAGKSEVVQSVVVWLRAGSRYSGVVDAIRVEIIEVDTETVVAPGAIPMTVDVA